MSGHATRLVSVAYMVVLSSAVVALVNCGGGERPEVAQDLAPDASAVDGGSGDDAPATVSISGFDPTAGILFGDEGLVNCGSQAPDKVLKLTNPTASAVSFTAKLTSGADLYALSSEAGEVSANGEATIQIVPKPIPQTSDVTPDLYAGTVEVQIADGRPPTIIRLHQTARGAIISTTLAAGTYDFGDVKVATTGTHQFSMTNAGNVEVTASFALGAQDFKIAGAQTSTVPLKPAQTASQSLTLAPSDTVAYTDTLAVSFNTSAVHCKPPPTNTTLKGKGATSVLVAPGTLNFGQINCGAQALSQLVKITSTAAMSFRAVLVKGETDTSPFTLENAANGDSVVPGTPVPMTANSTFDLRVVPKTVPNVASTADNAFGDTLRIETTAPGDQPHVTTLNQTARGAVFVMAPIALVVLDKPVGHKKSTAFTISNTGNVSAPYNISVALDPGQSAPAETFSLNLDTGTLLPGAANARGGLLETTVPPTSQVTGKVDLRAGNGAVMCADLPPKMNVSIELQN